MSTKDLLDEAMKLKPEERFTLVEGLIKSLDEPDKKLDAIWAEENPPRVPWVLAEFLCSIHHDRTECLGDVSVKPSRDR